LLILETQPDIVALQGWTGRHQPVVFLEENWQVRRDRELCLGSRFPIRKVQESDDPLFHDGRGALARYELQSPVGTIHLINLHLASPREALEAVAGQPFEAKTLVGANSDMRRSQSAIVQRWALEVNGPTLLAGDFNTPTDSTISSEFWSPFHNAFTEAGLGWGYTFFTRRSAVRIDHQLGGPGWQCRRCWVGPDVGSPHRPLIADWYISASVMEPTPP
jgi:endonuclease/exonuclease/phosphatase (EEP) superfamily protein YafD